MPQPADADASARIAAHIASLQAAGDWRGDMLARLRGLIRRALPDVQEDWKWQKAASPGVPVWSQDGGICTGETYKQAVKLTFFRGAALPDPHGLFNASLAGNTRRVIDLHEGAALDETAFIALIRAAAEANVGAKAKKKQ